MEEKTIGQADLANFLAEQHGLSHAQSIRVLRSLGDFAITLIEKGGKLRFPGLGSFEACATPARKARNPITGETLDVPEKRRIRFRPSSELKRAANTRC